MQGVGASQQEAQRGIRRPLQIHRPLSQHCGQEAKGDLFVN